MKKPTLSMRRPSLALAPKAAELEPEARLNVTLPADLHARVKARAAERRQSIREYVLELLARDGLQ